MMSIKTIPGEASALCYLLKISDIYTFIYIVLRRICVYKLVIHIYELKPKNNYARLTLYSIFRCQNQKLTIL